MKNAMLKIAAVCLCAAITTGIYAQCTSLPLPLQERVTKSNAILIGEVIARHCYADNDGNIYTLNKVMVKAWAKNHQADAFVYVITNGGVLKDKAQITRPSLQLALHQQYFIMLESDNQVSDDKNIRASEPAIKQAFAYADAQGAMVYQDKKYYDAPSSQRMDEPTLLQKIYSITSEKAKTPSGAPYAGENKGSDPVQKLAVSITGFVPNPTNAGTIDPNDFLTINGSGFGGEKGKVEFKNADDGGNTYITVPDTSDYVFWSDNSITVKVPDNAGTGTIRVNGKVSADKLTINYAHQALNSSFNSFDAEVRQRYYLRNITDPGGYIFKYNISSGLSTNTSAKDAFERALNNWRCKTGINWSTKGSTQKAYADDGENVVMFESTLSSGELGVTTYRLSGGANSNCNEENTVWFLKEVDIRFKTVPSSRYDWQFGPQLPTSSQYDFETVALHELGHAHGLGHRIAPGETMNYALPNGVYLRTPATAELEGANDKMSYSTVATCFNPPGSGKPMTKASCVLPVSIIGFKAQLQNKNVLLSWQTANEVNADYFTVERSVNGIDFIPVTKITAAGSSSGAHTYSYTDNVAALPAGLVYYRLRETDKDGESAVAGLSNVTIAGKAFSVYPNPAKAFVTIEGQNIMQVQILDAAGKLVIGKKIANESYITVSTSGLSRGVYTIVIKDNKDNTNMRKLVIE